MTRWYKYPTTPHKEDGKYLATCVGYLGNLSVLVLDWSCAHQAFYYGMKKRVSVVAWTELPKPYVPEELKNGGDGK